MEFLENYSFLYTVTYERTLAEIAEVFCCSQYALRRLNQGRRLMIRRGSRIRVPMGACRMGVFFPVQYMQTLVDLSACTGLAPEDILRSNPGVNLAKCRMGQIIILPVFHENFAPQVTAVTKRKKEAIPQLLKRTKLTMPLLQILNPEEDVFRLEYDREYMLNAIDWSVSKQQFYTLVSGETLLSVAKKFGLDPKVIVAQNPNIEPQAYREGVTICLPYQMED